VDSIVKTTTITTRRLNGKDQKRDVFSLGIQKRWSFESLSEFYSLFL
jgi:hypothetical protein